MNITEIVNNSTEIIEYNMTLSNTTIDNDYDNDNNFLTIEITPIYLLLLTIPCFLSIICCLSFLSYGFIKVLINKK